MLLNTFDTYRKSAAVTCVLSATRGRSEEVSLSPSSLRPRGRGMLPERISRYEIERRLGIGGMAETFVRVFVSPDGFKQRV